MSNSIKTTNVTLLHISDTHFKSTTDLEKDPILVGLLNAIEELTKGDWRPDVILFTGDISHSGKSNQFGVASRFFDQLLGKCQLAKDQFFCVPGNHDINWDHSPDGPWNIKDDRASDNFFRSRTEFREYFEQFSNYQTFLRNYLNRQFNEECYYFPHNIDVKGYQVGIGVLNSAWLPYRKYGQGRQLLGKYPLSQTLQGIQDASLKVVLFHHPIHWLLGFEQRIIRSLLGKYADLVLNGHQDKPDIEIRHVGETKKLLYLQAGPSHGGGSWSNRIHVIRCKMLSRVNLIGVRVYPLKFETEINRWVLDTTLFETPDYIGFFSMQDTKELASKIKEKVGFEYLLYYSKSDIGIDGSANVTRTIEILVEQDAVSSLDYNHFSRTITNFSINVVKISGTSDVKVSIVNSNPPDIRFSIDFNPPIKKNEKMTFQINETYTNGYPMIIDQIADFIRNGKWGGEPYTMKSSFVKYPTKKLIVSALLPEDYKIIASEEYFDVRIGYYGGGRHSEEFRRMKKNKCFSRDIVNHKQILKLNVDDPITGLVYLLRWKPPTRNDYEKMMK